VIHQPVSMVLQSGAEWLAGRDQRQPTGSGSKLETLCDDVLYKSALLFFTLLVSSMHCLDIREAIWPMKINARLVSFLRTLQVTHVKSGKMTVTVIVFTGFFAWINFPYF